MSSNRRQRLSAILLWSTATLATMLLASLVAITVLLAAKLAMHNRSIYRLALSASFTDVLALAASVILLLLHQRRMSRKAFLFLGLVSVILAASAAFLTIFALIWVWNVLKSANAVRDAPGAQVLLVTGFALWSVTIVALFVLHVLILRPREQRTTVPAAEIQLRRASPAKLVKKSTTSQSPTSFVMSPSQVRIPIRPEPVSSAFSAYSDSIKPPFRFSVSRAMRPVTSRTRLLFHHPLLSPDSNSSPFSTQRSSMDAIRESDGFEDWEGARHDTRFLKKYAEHHQLEPIPGSRPTSPRTPLDGPIPEHSPALAQQSPRLVSFHDSTAFPRAKIPSPRKESSEGPSQFHIHPLFRSESSGSPPLASPNTVITASPYAGQSVSCEHDLWSLRRLHSAPQYRSESPTLPSLATAPPTPWRNAST